MKKYTPSVKNNNAVKEELCSEMKGLLYRIEKGKYDRRLDRDGLAVRRGEVVGLARSEANIDDGVRLPAKRIEEVLGDAIAAVRRNVGEPDLLFGVIEVIGSRDTRTDRLASFAVTLPKEPTA